MKEYKAHELSNIIPSMTNEEYRDLKLDIQTYGVKTSIILFEDQILDGRHRYQVCKELKIEPKFEEYKGSNPLSYVVSLNIKRRHLNASQIGAITAVVAEKLADEAKQRQQEHAGTAPGRKKTVSASLHEVSSDEQGKAMKIAAKVTGGKERYGYEAKKIKEHSQKAFDDVLSGKLTIREAKRDIKEAKNTKERETLVKSAPKNARIIEGDLSKVGDQIADNSVDLIFTDPPYDEASIPLYNQLAELAKRILKPGGSLICYVGHHAVPQVCELMTRHLKFWWLIACKHGGASARLQHKCVLVEWKPLLWFVKSDRRDKEYVVDFIQSQSVQKKFHNWEQSSVEAMYYIEKLTRQGELVCDPFCGSGTTCIAAINLKRDYIAIEKDSDTAKIARKRIEDLISKSRKEK